LPGTKTNTVTAPSGFAAKEYLLAVQEVLERLDHAVIDQMVEVIWCGYQAERTLFLFGNGGSAALASHFACDIGKGTIAGRGRRLKTIALTDNVALITAWANDKGYDDIFSEQLDGLAEKGDIAMAISGSGNSPNVIRALEVAKSRSILAVALTGASGGLAKRVADYTICIPSEETPRIQECHILTGHVICEIVERIMFEHCEIEASDHCVPERCDAGNSKEAERHLPA